MEDDEEYPVNLRTERREEATHDRQLRPSSMRDLVEGKKTTSAQSSCVRETGRIWNQAPMRIKKAATVPIKGAP